MVRDYYENGQLQQLSDNLLADSLDEKTRESLGQIHPTFMGGEYLPGYKRGEVEIARIELASTTADVISIRARPSGSRILYRICDEYDSSYKLPQKSSSQPFSLAEFIRFLDAVDQGTSKPDWSQFGFVLEFNESNFDSGAALEDFREFSRIESEFYPELELHYAQAIEEWYEACAAELSGGL
jgi:hypothetical protein